MIAKQNETNIHIVLIRGINVGGKNKVLMASLRECLEQLGFSNVSTYIASGNVILESDKNAYEISERDRRGFVRNALKLDDEFIKVLVLTREQLPGIVNDNKPEGFGEAAKESITAIRNLSDRH